MSNVKKGEFIIFRCAKEGGHNGDKCCFCKFHLMEVNYQQDVY